MPYDDNFEYNTDNSLFDNDDFDALVSEEIQTSTSELTQETSDSLRSGDSLKSESDSSIDYTDYLESIIANQESIIANQESLLVYNLDIRDNSYRLYYFIGGLYVAFAIVIMIKFFKTFLF